MSEQPGSTDQGSQLVSTWNDVEKVIKAHAFPKWAGWVITGSVILILCLIGLGAWNFGRINDLVNQNHALVQQVQMGAVQSCKAGNSSRGTNKKIWDEFLTIAVDNPEIVRTRAALDSEVAALGLPDNVKQGFEALIVASWTTHPGNKKLVQGFEQYIAAHEYPVNCTKAYLVKP